MARHCKTLALMLLCAAATFSCAADTIWDYEAVDSVGFGTHPKVNADYTDPNNKVTVEGIALAGVEEILSTSGDYGQYTAFIQDDTSDRGGMQAWAGSWFYGSMWSTLRLTDYIDFQAGDKLRITGFLQDAGRGKAVINHRHSNNPDLVFHVEVIGHPGLPDPELIPMVANCNYFDQTRADGGEFYQTRYVMLHGVQITAGTWGSDQLMTIADASGSVGMKLSVMGDFDSYSQPTGKLNVVGIFDQEDTVTPYTGDYRVWVKKYEDIAVALDSCREVRLQGDGDRVALVNKVVSRVYDGYFYVQDADRAGGIRIDSARRLRPGDVVSVQGLVSRVAGEKVITPKYLSLSRSAPKPVFVTSPTLWGEGLDVKGLLVKAYVTVGTDQGDGTYTATDDAGKTILIQTNGLSMPAQGTNAAIAAVASDSGGVPLLLLARAQDIQVIN